jgi:hypothetical protein
MLRTVVSALAVLGLCLGIALADEFGAVISKVEGNKVTFTKMKGKEKIGDEMTLPVADSVKVVWGKFNKETKKVEVGDDVDDGIKNKMFSDLGDKGKRATIVTDDDNKKITEIRIFKGGKKKKDQ